MPILTASRDKLSKNLWAYEPMFQQDVQLDIRTTKATAAGHGTSRLWTLPADGMPSESIPLHRDEAGKRWWVHFMPVHMCDADHVNILHAIAEDFEDCKCAYEPLMQMHDDQMTAFEAQMVLAYVSAEALVGEVVTSRDATQAMTSTAKLPEGKRMDIIFARHPDEHETRGVKSHMPKSKFKKMAHSEFARNLQHTGCGPKCAVCRMASGAMRTIFKIVDKFMETRSGYMLSMDMQVLSHRSRAGMKYYVTVRCMASKYIVGFKLAKKNDIVHIFKQWVLDIREDPIYRNYNWQMISVIKCDNDGAWLRKSKTWMPMVDALDVRMFYVAHDRYEDSAEAESTVHITSVQGKKGLLARNAPANEWDTFWDSGVWLLNRTIARVCGCRAQPRWRPGEAD